MEKDVVVDVTAAEAGVETTNITTTMMDAVEADADTAIKSIKFHLNKKHSVTCYIVLFTIKYIPL